MSGPSLQILSLLLQVGLGVACQAILTAPREELLLKMLERKQAPSWRKHLMERLGEEQEEWEPSCLVFVLHTLLNK